MVFSVVYSSLRLIASLVNAQDVLRHQVNVFKGKDGGSVRIDCGLDPAHVTRSWDHDGAEVGVQGVAGKVALAVKVGVPVDENDVPVKGGDLVEEGLVEVGESCANVVHANGRCRVPAKHVGLDSNHDPIELLGRGNGKGVLDKVVGAAVASFEFRRGIVAVRVDTLGEGGGAVTGHSIVEGVVGTHDMGEDEHDVVHDELLVLGVRGATVLGLDASFAHDRVAVGVEEAIAHVGKAFERVSVAGIGAVAIGPAVVTKSEERGHFQGVGQLLKAVVVQITDAVRRATLHVASVDGKFDTGIVDGVDEFLVLGAEGVVRRVFKDVLSGSLVGLSTSRERKCRASNVS